MKQPSVASQTALKVHRHLFPTAQTVLGSILKLGPDSLKNKNTEAALCCSQIKSETSLQLSRCVSAKLRDDLRSLSKTEVGVHVFRGAHVGLVGERGVRVGGGERLAC